MGIQDQRNYIRYQAKGSLLLKPKDGTSRVISADLVDISFLGMGIYAKERIEAGTSVDFELLLQQWTRPVTGEARVKGFQAKKVLDANVFKMGIVFTDTDKDAIQNIITWIQKDQCSKARKRKESEGRFF